MIGTKNGIITRDMIRTLQEAVDYGTLYHGIPASDIGTRMRQVDRMIRLGLLERKPRGYFEISELGYRALRGDAG